MSSTTQTFIPKNWVQPINKKILTAGSGCAANVQSIADEYRRVATGGLGCDDTLLPALCRQGLMQFVGMMATAIFEAAGFGVGLIVRPTTGHAIVLV